MGSNSSRIIEVLLCFSVSVLGFRQNDVSSKAVRKCLSKDLKTQKKGSRTTCYPVSTIELAEHRVTSVP